MSNETDVTIHVGGETFPVHRSVLEAASPAFEVDLENNATGEDFAPSGVDDDR
uniref:Uncharacterized protein n=1 Tax=Aegilops tauschii TaxID=37682 RepID=N1QQW2_AEGTA